MIAYFTTAVFDQLYRKDGCTAADVAALRKAIYGRELTVRRSPHHLEEILLGRKVSPQALSAQIRQALSFASLRSLIKPCEHLLIGEVRDYAARGAAGNPFVHGPIQDDVSSGIGELIESDGEEFTDEFREVLSEAQRQKTKLAAFVDQQRATVAEPINAIPAEERRPLRLWQTFAMPLASAIADFADVLEPCRERGLEGLLKVRTVRVVAALTLGDFIGSAMAPKIPVHHVLSAAASKGVLVAGSGELRESLAPLAAADVLPVGFEVIGLTELLGRVAAR